MKIKKILKQICPPFLWSILKNIVRGSSNQHGFFGVYSKISEVPFDNPWHGEDYIFSEKQALSSLLLQDNEQRFLPLPHIDNYGDYLWVINFIANLLSHKNSIRVLDHCGGNGKIYYIIHPYLVFPEKVEWSVVDNSTLQLKNGQDFLDQRVDEGKGDYKIKFMSDLPNPSSEKFDIVYVNTSTQYYPEYQKTIRDLLLFKPKYFVLTRLLSGEGKTFITRQKLFGKSVSCRFVNSHELIKFFLKNGYNLVFKSPNKQESFGKGTKNKFKDIPEEYQIPFSINLVFGKMKGTIG